MNLSGAPVAPPRSRKDARSAGCAAPSSRLARCRRLVAGLLLATALSAVAAAPVLAQTRTLTMQFSHTGENISVAFKRDGQFIQSGVRDLNRFLRDWRRNESTQMDPELFDLLWEVQQEFGGKTITVVSAYRSPATNAMLRSRSRGVAKHSQHMEGNAIDFYIKGADISKLRASGVRRQVGGVGYYPTSGSPFVHMDVGSVRAWPRMSRSELVRIFPDGKTLHLPSDGKPLAGYAEAQRLEKEGKLASLNRGGRGGGGGGGLLALVTGGRNRAARDDDARVVATTRATGRASRAERPREEPARAAAIAAAPVPRVETAPPTRAQPADDVRSADVATGAFRALPTVSLGALIGRARDEAPPQVQAVALPAGPLTAVAVQPVPEPAPEAAAEAEGAFVPPVPRIAPRPDAPVGAPAAADAPAAVPPVAPASPDADPVAEILVAAATPAGSVAALPLRRPARDDAPDTPSAPSGIDALLPLAVTAGRSDEQAGATAVASLAPADPIAETVLGVSIASLGFAPATATLAYAAGDTVAPADASPLSAAAAIIPRTALAAPVPQRPADPGRAVERPVPSAPLVPASALDALMSPVLGATPDLIADPSGVSSARFAELTLPDRNTAARDGILLAQGFLGAPSGLSDGTDDWLATERFTGTRITVFARPHS